MTGCARCVALTAALPYRVLVYLPPEHAKTVQDALNLPEERTPVSILVARLGELAGELERLQAERERLREWTLRYGADLVPPPGWSDSFGDGMRLAKGVVAGVLLRGDER